MKNRTRYEQMPESIHKTYSPKDARWAIGGFTFFLHAIYCFLLFPELQRFLRQPLSIIRALGARLRSDAPCMGITIHWPYNLSVSVYPLVPRTLNVWRLVALRYPLVPRTLHVWRLVTLRYPLVPLTLHVWRLVALRYPLVPRTLDVSSHWLWKKSMTWLWLLFFE